MFHNRHTQRTADDAADNRVRRRNRQAFVGSEQQPQSRRQECRHHDKHKLHRLEVHTVQIDDTFAYSIGYLSTRDDRTADLKYRGNQQSLRDRQRPRPDAGTERVGNIVAADIKRHEHAEHGGNNEKHAVIVVGITQTPIDKIAYHADQHGGKDSINQFQVRTHLSLSHGRFLSEHRRVFADIVTFCNFS